MAIHKKTPERNSWEHMLRRCNNPKAHNYRLYGGRGIKCLFASFDEFLEAVGQRPSLDHSIDRIDNNGHYERGNVRWATKAQQNRNTRANTVTAESAAKILALKADGMREPEIAAIVGLSPRTVRNVMEGRTWSDGPPRVSSGVPKCLDLERHLFAEPGNRGFSLPTCRRCGAPNPKWNWSMIKRSTADEEPKA